MVPWVNAAGFSMLPGQSAAKRGPPMVFVRYTLRTRVPRNLQAGFLFAARVIRTVSTDLLRGVSVSYRRDARHGECNVSKTGTDPMGGGWHRKGIRVPVDSLMYVVRRSDWSIATRVHVHAHVAF